MNDNQQMLMIQQYLKDSKGVSCEKCNHHLFVEKFALRKVSRLITGSPSDTVIPVPVFACSACGHVNSEFAPKEFSLTDEASDQISD
jgi:hypothetical protein